jgi:hypothetical protein
MAGKSNLHDSSDPRPAPSEGRGTRTPNHPSVTWIYSLILLTFLSLPALGQEDANEEEIPSSFRWQNSLQSGIEFDSNVFKTFGGSEGDFLLRSFFKSLGSYSPTESTKLSWDYQGGGKVFFDKTEKDTLIQFVEFPFSWQPASRVEIVLNPDFKYQHERSGVDPTQLDLNEDYYSTTTKLDFRFFLPSGWLIEPFTGFTYFRFSPTLNYSFFREWGGATLQKTVGSLYAYGAQYSYGRQQFDSSDREDREHQVSGFIQYLRVPFFSVRYTFERTNSSLDQFSFNNHRITLLLSVPILPRENSDSAGGEVGMPPALFALHLLGTLQLKRFPSVFDYTAEGQRYLLTGAEDDNFNSVVAKLSFHPFARWAFEAKYTRHSNELSSQQSSFSRSLYYTGARFSF